MKDPVETARNLRRNQSDAERKLWSRLRNRQLEKLKFRRQHPIPPYTVDFFCEDKMLVIEIDGGQHTPEKDAARTRFLETQGYKVIRFWNNDVLTNIEGVLQTIVSELTSIPTPRPASPCLPTGKGEDTKRVCLAKIATAHGVRGLVKLTVYADDPANLEMHGPLFTSETGAETMKISLHKPMNKHWLAEIEGIADRTAAEKLRGTELWLPRDKLPTPEEGEHYYADLVGMAVVDDKGQDVGKVAAVHNFGAGDLLDVQPPAGQSFYLPFTKEYILEITGSVIRVNIPEGLIE